MRVLSWNLWGRCGDWRRREPGIIRTLKATDPDFICLQEVWWNGDRSQVDRLRVALDYPHVAGPHGKDRPAVGAGHAVLSRWPILQSWAFPLVSSPDDPRSLLLCRLSAPLADVWVASVHLSWRDDEQELRFQQVETVSRLLRREAPGVRNTVVAGDLNTSPDAPEIAPLLDPQGDHIDVWRAVHPRAEGWTWRADNPHVARDGRENRRIDVILINRDSVWVPRAARLAGWRRQGGHWPSDHLAVVADLAPEHSRTLTSSV